MLWMECEIKVSISVNRALRRWHLALRSSWQLRQGFQALAAWPCQLQVLQQHKPSSVQRWWARRMRVFCWFDFMILWFYDFILSFNFILVERKLGTSTSKSLELHQWLGCGDIQCVELLGWSELQRPDFVWAEALLWDFARCSHQKSPA